MKPQQHERKLVGQWVSENVKTRCDAICERIEWLISNHLKKIAISKEWGAWETLYKYPDDGRFWECTYPQGEMYGGGPPSSTVLSPEQAKIKYQFN